MLLFVIPLCVTLLSSCVPVMFVCASVTPDYTVLSVISACVTLCNINICHYKIYRPVSLLLQFMSL